MLKRTIYLSYILASGPLWGFTLDPIPDYTAPVSSWPPVTVHDLVLSTGAVLLRPLDQNSFSITLYTPSTAPSGERTDAASGRLMGPCKIALVTREVTCDGVFLNIWGEPWNDENAKAALRQLAMNRPIKMQRIGNGWEQRDCLILATVFYSGRGYQYRSSQPQCTPHAEIPPTSCSVTGPTVLMHPTQQSNQIVSSVGDQWRISCTAAARVKISSSRSVTLSSNKGEITSRLYVGRAGVTDLELDVDRTANVYIESKLETPSAVPGLYSGSGVITITWD